MEKFLEVHRKEELVKKREKERLKEENSASSVVDKTEGGDGGNDHDENIRKGDEEGEHSEGEKSPSHGKSFEEASTNDQDVEAFTGQSRSRDEKEVNDEDENEDEGEQPQAKKQKVVDENENDDDGNEEEEGDEDEE